MSIPTNARLSDLINYRLRIHTIDNKSYTGTLLSFDDKLNLVLSETEESRIPKKAMIQMKKNPGGNHGNINREKRTLGLIILRGDQIVNLTVESSPLTSVKDRLGGSGKDRPLKKIA